MSLNRDIWLRSRRDLWLLRAIAAVISLLLWITVLGGKKMEISKKVALDYQLAKDLVVASDPPREVTFRISGPRAFIREIEEKPMSIPIELGQARAGDYEVQIQENMLDVPLGLKVISVSQSTIALRLDRVATKTVPVRTYFPPGGPEGLRVISVTSKPSTVELRGPQQRLAALESVPTEAITLSSNSLRQEFEVKLDLKDLPGVTLEDGQPIVHVVAELEGSLSRKWVREIPVGLRVKGRGAPRTIPEPASLGIRMRPGNVAFLLEGPEPIVSKLRAGDVEVWAEIPELKAGSHRARLAWRLSPDLRVVKRSTDWAEVTVPPLR